MGKKIFFGSQITNVCTTMTMLIPPHGDIGCHCRGCRIYRSIELVETLFNRSLVSVITNENDVTNSSYLDDVNHSIFSISIQTFVISANISYLLTFQIDNSQRFEMVKGNIPAQWYQ